MSQTLNFTEFAALINSLSNQVKQSSPRNQTLAETEASSSPQFTAADVLVLRSSFPDIKEEHILAVVNHQFYSWDLYKLDPKYRDRSPTLRLNSATGQFEIINYDAEDYKTPTHLRRQLMIYVSILIAHLTAQQSQVEAVEAKR